MFIIKTHIEKSPIDGFGVFSSVPVKKGETVWLFEPTFDRQFTPEQVACFPESARIHILKCGFLDKNKNIYYLGIDYDSFSNHSDNPNLTIDKKISCQFTDSLIASRDINPGEELTQNYYEYDEEQDIKNKFCIENI